MQKLNYTIKLFGIKQCRTEFAINDLLCFFLNHFLSLRNWYFEALNEKPSYFNYIEWGFWRL